MIWNCCEQYTTPCLVIPLILSEHFYIYLLLKMMRRHKKKVLLDTTISGLGAFTELLTQQSLSVPGRQRGMGNLLSLSHHSFSWIKCSQQQHWLSTDWHSIRRGGSSIQIRRGRKDLNKLTVLSSITAVTCQFAVVPRTRLSVLLRTH